MAEANVSPTITYFLQHLDLLLWRDYLQELLTLPDRSVAHWDAKANAYVLETESPLYIGKLIQVDASLMSIASFTKVKRDVYHLVLSTTEIIPTTGVALIHPQTAVVLQPGVVANYPRGAAIETTVGRIILNQLILSVPFGELILYINQLWNIGDLEKRISDLIIREAVTVDQVNTYIANLYFLGHSPEFLVPNISEKALTTDPRIALRKQELLEQNKVALAAGDAVVMSQIEQELIAMDKAYLEGDSSMRYYTSDKAFSIQRKKLLLTQGMLETFGNKGNYDFVANSLEEGWTPETFPKIVNDIRSGSYSRAKETAKGGEESKFLARVFSSARIVEDDCHTTRSLNIIFRDDNSLDYVYRHYITDDGTVAQLTPESAKALIGKTVRIRSPLFCQAVNGYCFECFGGLFRTLDQRVFTTAATAIGAQMTRYSLARVHGGVITTVEITSLNNYVV